MILVQTMESHDPRINLAEEEYVLKYLDPNETYLLFYINEPSIIIGRNQNTMEEINHQYVKDHGIHVVRRLSGGGAVYHDLGNLNFSIITKDDGESFRNFRRFTEPVIKALHRLGVNAELSGRNDITVGGRKISGNAQFSYKGRMFSHGTLLFNSEIDHVVAALNVNMEKIQSKGIKSIRSRVANIREFLDREMDIIEFKNQLLHNLYEDYEQIPTYTLTEQDYEKVMEISRERYQNWDWNFGKSPAFNVKGSKRFEGVGQIDIRLDVKSGKIENAKIYGDFFGNGDISLIENRLKGLRYDEEEIRNALLKMDLKLFFGNITVDDLVGLFF
ncbi:lipoate--protein ligase [Tepidibacillus fermentans]